MKNPLARRNKPVYNPTVCTRSAGAHFGKPWQPFSYIVRQPRGGVEGTHNSPSPK